MEDFSSDSGFWNTTIKSC